MHKKITVFGIATALLILAVCIGTVTAYTNYNTVWSSSGNQILTEDYSPTNIAAGTTPTHSANYFHFTIAASKSIGITTPFINTITMTGTHPKVRWLYFQLNMPTGVWVTNVDVYSGATKVYSGNPSWEGTGADALYTLDTGHYYDMVRGINTEIEITNSHPSEQDVYSYGAGARWDW